MRRVGERRHLPPRRKDHFTEGALVRRLSLRPRPETVFTVTASAPVPAALTESSFSRKVVSTIDAMVLSH